LSANIIYGAEFCAIAEPPTANLPEGVGYFFNIGDIFPRKVLCEKRKITNADSFTIYGSFHFKKGEKYNAEPYGYKMSDQPFAESSGISVVPKAFQVEK